MKIRTAFVTNSSSSSFILGFKDEDSIKCIVDELSMLSEEEKEEVISNIENNIISKEKAAEFFIENQWTSNWEFNGKRYWDLTKEEIHSKEYEKFIEDKKNELKNDLMNKMGDKIISLVKYDDCVNSMMEHEVMPSLSCTIERISHH